ncbi:MAG: hypothetical protein ABI035_08600, partial [Gemmatimonadaceae bacterium]
MTDLAVVTRVGHRRRVSAIGVACAAIACATVGCTRAKIATDIAPETPFAAFIAADSMRDSASKLVANHLLSAGAALYLHAGERDAANSAPGQSFYDAADAYLAAGMIDASISALDSAVRAGYHD